MKKILFLKKCPTWTRGKRTGRWVIDDTPFSLYPYNIQEIAFFSIDSNLYSDHVIQVGKLKKKWNTLFVILLRKCKPILKLYFKIIQNWEKESLTMHSPFVPNKFLQFQDHIQYNFPCFFANLVGKTLFSINHFLYHIPLPSDWSLDIQSKLKFMLPLQFNIYILQFNLTSNHLWVSAHVK